MPRSTNQLDEIFKHVEGKQAEYIKDLRDFVAVPSTSIDRQQWPKVRELMNTYNKRITDLGAKSELVEVGQFLGEGDQQCPPVLFASLGDDPKKKTILLYFRMDTHMVKAEQWNSDPFTLTEKNGYLIGRGAANGKGPALCWLHVFEAYKELKKTLPVNLKFVVEGSFERGSVGFEAACLSKKSFMTSQVDCVCITNNTWLGTKKPCIVHAQRGVCYFGVTVQGMDRDLHSGDYGGVVCEPMSDLILVMNALQDHNYKITIPGLMDPVIEPTQKDYDAFEKITYDVDDVKEFVGTTKLTHKENKARILVHNWRMPTLSLHGIEGAETDEWEKTVIPSKVIGKFSIRIVENQTPEQVAKCVADYIGNLWKEINSINSLEVKLFGSTRPWSADPNDKIFKVAQRAVKHAYGVDADMIQDGATNGATVPLKLVTGKPVVLLCVGTSHCKAQCPNEQLPIKNYMDGHRLVAAFMHEVAESF